MIPVIRAGISLLPIYKTTVPLPGARLELEIVSPAHTYIYSLRRFRATRLSVENGVIYFEKRSDGSLESRERKEFRFLPEMRPTSFPRTALTYSYIYYNFHMSRWQEVCNTKLSIYRELNSKIKKKMVLRYICDEW